MEKLSMCRICLVQNVRMYVVVNKDLQELYEKLTDVPFVTEDRRPMLACFFCCARIKQCAQFQRRCVEAEQLFTQMLNEECEPKPVINDGRIYCGGFNKTSVEHLSIGNECSVENITIKEEPPDVCDKLDNVIEEEHQIEEIELKPIQIAYPDEKDTPHDFKSEYILPHHCESDSEEDIPLTQIKIEEEELEKTQMEKLKARETERVNVKIPELAILRTRFVDTNTARPKKNGPSDSETQYTRNCTCKPNIKIKESNCDQRNLNGEANKQDDEHSDENCTKCGEICQCDKNNKKQANKKFWKCDICQRILSRSSDLKRHIRTHTGEKPFKCKSCPRCFSHKGDLTKHIRIHTGEKPCKCNICQRSFSQTSHLKRHVSRVHSNKRPYKCDVCHRSYSEKGNLQRHSRIHIRNSPTSRLAARLRNGKGKCESEGDIVGC